VRCRREPVLDAAPCLFAHKDLAGGGLAAKARREVDGLADYGLVSVGARADGAEDDAARGNADVQRERKRQAFGAAFHPLKHRESGVCRADGVLGARVFDAPDRHHAVTDVLVDLAAEALYGAGEIGEERVHDLAHLLRLALARHLRET
jgi:hypothetical protein